MQSSLLPKLLIGFRSPALEHWIHQVHGSSWTSNRRPRSPTRGGSWA